MISFFAYFFKYLLFFKSINIKWIIFIIILHFHIIFGNNLFSNNTRNNDCTSVFHILKSRGIDIEIPRQPLNDVVLRYCELSSDGSCCTYNIETKLALLSKINFEKSTKESIGKLHSILNQKAQKFNEIFTQLLMESKKEFHAMFKRTYGIIYEQNAYVFSDFFNELETYFIRGKLILLKQWIHFLILFIKNYLQY